MKSDEIKLIVHNHFNILASQYDKKSLTRLHYLSAIDKVILKKIRQEGATQNLLDVGCGTGTRINKIFPTPFNGITAYGLDISMNMLKIAKTKDVRDLILADMQYLPFKESSFSIITCLFNTIGYLGVPEERHKTFLEFRRVLCGKGLIFIDFMNRWHLGEKIVFKRSITTAIWLYFKSFFPGLKNQGNIRFELELNANKKVKGFVHGFSMHEAKGLFCLNGFKIVESFVVGYGSGNLKKYRWQGQYFVVAEKID